MMPIKAPQIQLSPDQQVKQKAAVKQMQDLLKELDHWVKYRLLTHKDRQQLLRKGYARDLVDNLVYFTQRNADDVKQKDDQLVIGFTNMAFDPSLYACDRVMQALSTANAGRCSWCESAIVQNDAISSHYRPPYGYSQQNILHRRAYFDLAYQQDNLFYSCRDCSERYKGDVFPVIGCGRPPTVELKDERSAIINPYEEQPRHFIRFNPVNGHAYAYDQVLKFYQDVQGKGVNDVDQILWQDPSSIPNQYDSQGNQLSSAMVDNSFQTWLNKSPNNQGPHFRGQVTIDSLGLNRVTLIKSRVNHLRQLRLMYLAQFAQEHQGEADSAAGLFKSLGVLPDNQGQNVPEYVSMTMDAVNTWLQMSTTPDKSSDSASDSDTPKSSIDWLGNYAHVLDGDVAEHQLLIPANIRSGLSYLVLESELGLKNKRRIVNLHSSDLLYGSLTSKCVFLPINWQADLHNVIKVHESKHTWETSFDELFVSRPEAIQSLFAHSEVWAEGDYQALV